MDQATASLADVFGEIREGISPDATALLVMRNKKAAKKRWGLSSTRERFNKVAADQAWKSTIAWFNKYVRATT